MDNLEFLIKLIKAEGPSSIRKCNVGSKYLGRSLVV
jgi:hypothetical protein